MRIINPRGGGGAPTLLGSTRGVRGGVPEWAAGLCFRVYGWGRVRFWGGVEDKGEGWRGLEGVGGWVAVGIGVHAPRTRDCSLNRVMQCHSPQSFKRGKSRGNLGRFS